MSNSYITDLSYLEDMSQGDSTLIIEMIELFLLNTPQSLNNIKNHYQNGEMERLAAEAHKFKPNLSYMGLEEARDLVIEIEHSAKKNSDVDSIPSKIDRLEEICEEAFQELKSRMAELKN